MTASRQYNGAKAPMQGTPVGGVNLAGARLPAPFQAKKYTQRERQPGQVLLQENENLARYLKEASATPLLTPQQEVALANRIRSGDEAAREEMIKANLLLVVSLARQYEHVGVPILDLISEGNVGLMRAVDRYDPTVGAKFSTYASWWIKQAIRFCLSKTVSTIRIPTHCGDKIRSIAKAERELNMRLGREASIAELAKESKLPEATVQNMLQAAQVRRASSLDAPMGEESNSPTVGESLADERCLPAPEKLIQQERRLLVQAMLGDEEAAAQLDEGVREMATSICEKMTPRERTIIVQRFGLGRSGGQAKTLEIIGKKYGVSRERIRQLEAKTLKKIRRALQKIDTEGPPSSST